MLQFHGVLEHFARALCTQSENVLMLKLRDTQIAKHWTTIVWRCLCAKTNTSLAFFCKRYNVSRTLLLCTYRLSCHSLSIPAIEQIWSHCWNKIRAVFYLIMIKNNKICVVALMHVVCYIYMCSFELLATMFVFMVFEDGNIWYAAMWQCINIQVLDVSGLCTCSMFLNGFGSQGKRRNNHLRSKGSIGHRI